MPDLHAYQHAAVAHLWRNPKAALWMDCGLGKSAVVLSALSDEYLPVLVVAPKRVAENVWRPERDKWRPDLSLAVAAGSPAQRAEVLSNERDITVIGRDNIKDVPVGKFRTIVLDESHGFKSRQSQRWKYAKRLVKDATYVWQLTGTPSPQSLLDLWPQLFLLDGGERLGPHITKFRDRYFSVGRQLRNGTVIEWKLRPGAEQRIHDLLADICLSMSAGDHLDLPPVTYNRITVPLPAKVKKLYDTFAEDLVANLALLGEESVHTAANAAVLSSKLSQVTAGFLYPDAEDPDGTTSHLHDEKTNAVVEVVEGTGSPVLVFYRFTEERDRLLAALPGARVATEPRALDEWNAGRVPVLLAHPASAGAGLQSAAVRLPHPGLDDISVELGALAAGQRSATSARAA